MQLKPKRQGGGLRQGPNQQDDTHARTQQALPNTTKKVSIASRIKPETLHSFAQKQRPLASRGRNQTYKQTMQDRNDGL